MPVESESESDASHVTCRKYTDANLQAEAAIAEYISEICSFVSRNGGSSINPGRYMVPKG